MAKTKREPKAVWATRVSSIHDGVIHFTMNKPDLSKQWDDASYLTNTCVKTLKAVTGFTLKPGESKRVRMKRKAERGTTMPCSKCRKLEAENRKLRAYLERTKGALAVISTWATFECKGMPAGHALDAEDTARLCKKVLDETNVEEQP